MKSRNTVVIGQGLEATLATTTCCDTGHDISEHLLRNSNICSHEFEKDFIKFSITANFQRWNANTFLINLCVIAGIPASYSSSNVGMVSNRSRETD